MSATCQALHIHALFKHTRQLPHHLLRHTRLIGSRAQRAVHLAARQALPALQLSALHARHKTLARPLHQQAPQLQPIARLLQPLHAQRAQRAISASLRPHLAANVTQQLLARQRIAAQELRCIRVSHTQAFEQGMRRISRARACTAVESEVIPLQRLRLSLQRRQRRSFRHQMHR